MKVVSILPLAALFLMACGPNTDDRAMMKDKMDLDDQRALVWKADGKNCTKMATDLAAFHDANTAKIEKIDKWWGGLASTTRKTLVSENQARWDAQDKALIQASLSCPKDVKVQVKQ